MLRISASVLDRLLSSPEVAFVAAAPQAVAMLPYRWSRSRVWFRL
jgi:hypothetical protein